MIQQLVQRLATKTNDVEREPIAEGNGQDCPKPGQTIAMQYTGLLKTKYDELVANGDIKPGEDWLVKLGSPPTSFDSSTRRKGNFETLIGVGQVIRGWDDGILGIGMGPDGGDQPMSVGERAVLHIKSEAAYADKAVGGNLIPANSDLVFAVQLVGITSGKSRVTLGS